MLVIGLTGGIGSGKSTVANLFAERGAPILDADVVARELALPDEPALKAIVTHFGKRILAADGTLNRSALREHVFTNPEERIWLENCLHPLIEARIQQQISLISGAPYCIVVIPLLVETAPYPFIHRILVIDAPEDQQIARVLTRDGTNAAQVNAILQTQATRNQRLDAADDVIINDKNLPDLIVQVDALHKKYVTMAI